MIIPPYLKSGDSIAIVATARKIDKAPINLAVNQLKAQGFNVILGSNLYAEQHQFAGTDLERAQNFQWALDTKEVKAIFCARGGYGTIKMCNLVDWSAFKQNPKWIVGYSDPTVLHAQANKLGVCSLHATMPINYSSNTPTAFETMISALKGNTPEPLTMTHHPFNQKGKANGELIGGNLSMIYSLMGTPYQLDTDGKILLLEDLDEFLYHIDRMMMTLKYGGLLDNLSGLVVGGMTEMKDNTIAFGANAAEIIRKACLSYNFPIAFNLPVGHIDDNRALKLGQSYQLEVNARESYFSCNV